MSSVCKACKVICAVTDLSHIPKILTTIPVPQYMLSTDLLKNLDLFR